MYFTCSRKRKDSCVAGGEPRRDVNPGKAEVSSRKALYVTLSPTALECPGGIFGIWLKEAWFGFHGIIYLVQSHFRVYRSYCWLNQYRNGFPGILLVPSVPTYLVSKHKRAGPEALTQHVQLLWLLASEPRVIEHQAWNVSSEAPLWEFLLILRHVNV